jgi:predicted helicase
MGNPPYSVSSSNKSEWITKLMKDYKEGLQERNIQPLDDDYIKFIRFAQWKIEQNKEGVIGIITNNSYLGGIIHRVMRTKLIKSFNKMYILNLHGNSLIKEETPDGNIDENVFDIRVGVSIILLIKKAKLKDSKIQYFDLYGTRENKYKFLNEKNLNNIEWTTLAPTKPYFFLNKMKMDSGKYNKSISLLDIFNFKSAGVKTSNDDIVVKFEKDELYESLEGKPIAEDKITDYYYRPFDIRKIYFDNSLIDRPREPLSNSMQKDNIALCCSRNTTMKGDFSSVLIANGLNDLKYCEYSRGCYFFPLYVYDLGETLTQSRLQGKAIKAGIGKQSNLKEEFKEFLVEQYPNKEITPEEVLEYIYAVLYSPDYRRRNKEFLKIDFPKILFVKDYSKFKRLSRLGNKLIQIHSMKTSLSKIIAKYEIDGTNSVDFIKYKDNKIYLNKDQYFSGVDSEVWKFNIGGYQVLDKWLKSRKGRKLTNKEIEHFVYIVTILDETIKIMHEIDKINI